MAILPSCFDTSHCPEFWYRPDASKDFLICPSGGIYCHMGNPSHKHSSLATMEKTNRLKRLSTKHGEHSDKLLKDLALKICY